MFSIIYSIIKRKESILCNFEFSMNRLVITLLFFATLISTAQNTKKIKVLFIGNSYTYVNNLPQLVADIARANGDTLVFDYSYPGGYTFNNHFYNATTINKIAVGGWNYVILQAQSQEPAFSPTQVNSQTLPYAVKLDSAIKHHNPCATTVFYETWGRKFGDASNCPFYPPICTYTGMQNSLKNAYGLFADTTKGILSPVGEAFRSSITSSPSIDLYQSDQSHPSIEGSYLAAAVFYEVVFQKSVISNTYNPGITTTNLAFFRQIAHSTFKDSLAVWNVGQYLPWAAFNYSLVTGNNYQFQPFSNYLNHKWYFGDGSSSNLVNASHTYSNSGTYTVSHVSYSNCKKDSVTAIITATLPPNALSEFINLNELEVWPNPCLDEINFKLNDLSKSTMVVNLYSTDGKIIYSGKITDKIDISEFKPGLYFLQISTQKQSRFLKLIKS
jgi:hypothetical protein